MILFMLCFLFSCSYYVSSLPALNMYPGLQLLLSFLLSSRCFVLCFPAPTMFFFPFPLCNRSILGNNYYHHHICCTNTRARTLPLLYYKGTLPLLCYKSKAQQIQKLNCIILRRGEGGEGVKRESEVWWHVLCIRPQAL